MSKNLWFAKDLRAGHNLAEGCIQDINLSIRAGERVAVLGGERSGSYMLLRVLCGLRPRREGTLQVFGHELPELQFFEDWENIFPRHIRHRLGVALEKDGLLANISVRESLETVMRFGGQLSSQAISAELVTSALDLFGLLGLQDLRPHQLSSAERRFAAIARTSLLSPEAYVFEGPTKNLDDRERERLFYACDELLENKASSLIVATEDWAFAVRYCPRVVVMSEGSVIFDGSWKEMRVGCPDYWSKVSQSLRRRWELDQPLKDVV